MGLVTRTAFASVTKGTLSPFLALCVLFWGFDCARAGHPMPYVKKLDEALALAKKLDRTVILYTGRIGLCLSNDPQAHFFHTILKDHPQLAAKTNRYVVCEWFLHANPAVQKHSPVQAANLYSSLILDRYHIRFFCPTLTFLDAQGKKLNGPFSQLVYCHPEFSAGTADCYATLQEYSEADPPIQVEEAQRRVLAAMTTDSEPKSGLFRSSIDAERKQKQILLETGIPSRSSIVGEEFAFVVRECRLDRWDYPSAGYAESGVTVVGSFRETEPFEGPILVRINDAYFSAKIQSVGQATGFNSVSFRPGEYYFAVYVRDEKVAQLLHKTISALRPKS